MAKPADPTLKSIAQRAQARLEVFQRITVEERLDALQSQGFYPHGVYMPNGEVLRAATAAKIIQIGAIPDVDERMRQFLDLQHLGETWQTRGVPGRSWPRCIWWAKCRPCSGPGA